MGHPVCHLWGTGRPVVSLDDNSLREYSHGRRNHPAIALRQALRNGPSHRVKESRFRVGKGLAGLAIARGRLAHLERDRGKPLSDSWRQHFLDYGRLAVMLNSLSGLDTDEITAIRRWASEHDQGWATLFFGAGILLRVESDFPWRSIGSGLLMASHSAKDNVKMLLDQYSQRSR